MNFNALARAIVTPNFSTNYLSQIAWTILRVVAGLFTIHNGLDKLGNIEGFTIAYVHDISGYWTILFSYCAAFTELLAGLLVALGLFTRPASFALLFTMSIVMYHHIKLAGLRVTSIELAGLYAAAYLFLTVNSAGLFSIDALIHGWLTAKNESTLISVDAVLNKSLLEHSLKQSN